MNILQKLRLLTERLANNGDPTGILFALTNIELDAMTELVDRLYRAVHIERQKTSRQTE